MNSIKASLTCVLLSSFVYGQSDDVIDLRSFEVFGNVAGGESAIGTEQFVSQLEGEVRVDLQSRGGSRYQTDITIRGGIFEGSGVAIGGVVLTDPQTGHYFGEVPLDPSFFQKAELWLGVENGFKGFNSTAGSINWQWAEISEGGDAQISFGSDSHLGGSFRVASNVSEKLSFEISISGEEGDGSIENGDYRMERASGRLSYELGEGRLIVYAGRVAKFYGWPAMYTGFATLNETDDYAISLFGFDYEIEQGDWFHHVGGYWRDLDDDYEFNRTQPNNFFEHETRVVSLQGHGGIAKETWDIQYRWIVHADEIKSSTSLVNGRFMEREYAKLALLGGKVLSADADTELKAYGGISLDTNNEDSTVMNPFAGISWTKRGQRADQRLYFEGSRASQVPGFTILNSGPSGLFGGNSELGREESTTIEGGYAFQTSNFQFRSVLFYREDDALIDWVFETGSSNSRQAEPLDSDTYGLELHMEVNLGDAALDLSYAWLDKDANYRDVNDRELASFYALNFAEHRLIGAFEYLAFDKLLVRLEGEWESYQDNLLRTGANDALTFNLYAEIRAFPVEGWSFFINAENIFEDDFQHFPGTPGRGREVAAVLQYVW